MLSLVHPCFRYGCVHVITCLCGTCMFYERQRSTLGVVLSTLLFEARSLTVIWSLSIRLYWLPVEPQGSFCLCLLSDEITCTHHHAFFFLPQFGVFCYCGCCYMSTGNLTKVDEVPSCIWQELYRLGSLPTLVQIVLNINIGGRYFFEFSIVSL